VSGNNSLSNITRLAGDASERNYFRINFSKGNAYTTKKNAVLCNYQQSTETEIKLALNKDQNKKIIYDYNELPEIWYDSPFGRFFFWNKTLRQLGLPVPEIYSAVSGQYFVMQDLGEEDLATIDNWNKDTEAIKLMRTLHEQPIPPAQLLEQIRAKYFRQKKISYELFFLLRHFERAVGPLLIKKELVHEFISLARKLTSISNQNKNVITHRDYHSRNIMVTDDTLFLIDFQDIFFSLPEYDLVSFVFDPYRNFKTEQKHELIKLYYGDQIRIPCDRLFYFAEQRLLEALGSYIFLAFEKKKSRYLKSIPVAVTLLKNLSQELNVNSNLAKPIMELLEKIIASCIKNEK